MIPSSFYNACISSLNGTDGINKLVHALINNPMHFDNTSQKTGLVAGHLSHHILSSILLSYRNLSISFTCAAGPNPREVYF